MPFLFSLATPLRLAETITEVFISFVLFCFYYLSCTHLEFQVMLRVFRCIAPSEFHDGNWQVRKIEEKERGREKKEEKELKRWGRK